MMETFNFLYLYLKKNNKKYFDNNYRCNDNYDCISYAKIKNTKFIVEVYNQEFGMYIINMKDFIIRITFHNLQNNKAIWEELRTDILRRIIRN